MSHTANSGAQTCLQHENIVQNRRNVATYVHLLDITGCQVSITC